MSIEGWRRRCLSWPGLLELLESSATGRFEGRATGFVGSLDRRWLIDGNRPCCMRYCAAAMASWPHERPELVLEPRCSSRRPEIRALNT